MATTPIHDVGSSIGPYRIEELLGRGGMGVVYRATDLRLGRQVALKLLSPELSGDARFRARFERESHLAASIDHAGIIPVYEAGETDGLLYIAMRYVDGSDLAQLLRCREELEAEQHRAEMAYEDNLAWRAEWEAAHGRKLGGRKPTPPDPDALPARKINTTDPDSRLICRTGKAPVPGYNAQAVASAEQIILAADLTQAANDSGQLEPMIAQAAQTLARAGIAQPLDTVLADGGYWSSPQISRLREQGLQPVVPTKAAGRTKPRTLSPRQGPEAERIDRLLETPEGAALYRRRQQLIEPVFAHTKFLRRIDRFQRRGLAACRAEWRLIAATHNILKLWRLAPGALAA